MRMKNDFLIDSMDSPAPVGIFRRPGIRPVEKEKAPKRQSSTPIRHVRVMFSSRNHDLIPDGMGGAVSLETVRKELQEELQKERFLGYRLLDVWINEEAGPAGANVREECREQLDEADIVIVIYNGQAGWAPKPGAVGICHEEMQRVLTRAHAKLRVIALDFKSNPSLGLVSPAEAAEKNDTNRKFHAEVSRRFNAKASDRQSLEDAVRLTIVRAIADFVKLAGEHGHRGRYDLGSPLDWSRRNYRERKKAMEQVVRAYLCEAQQAMGKPEEPAQPLRLKIGGEQVLVMTHAVPAAFGIAEARELVGRPYLKDHKIRVKDSENVIGPVHVIACYKSCTEAQINSFMGHPDIYVVQPDFGFFVADLTSFVQTFFLTSCRDETDTLQAMQDMFDWIDASGELERIVARAHSRQAILRVMAKEIRKERRIEAA